MKAGIKDTIIVADQKSGGCTLRQTRYTWDTGGNFSNRIDVLASETETFTCDFLARLTGVSGPYTESYTYNTIGNIMSRNGVSYTYGDNAHKHAVTAVGLKNYTYDANGNMITRGDQALVWDIENRLTSVSGNNTTLAQFYYDGDGNRVIKMENGKTTYYVNKYHDYSSTGNATSYYYLGRKLIASSENGTVRYLHQDHLTSTSLMTDDTGVQLGDTVKYLPFGEARAAVNIPTAKLFTGQRLDGTGLYYYNARYFIQRLGGLSARIYNFFYGKDVLSQFMSAG